MKVLKMCDGSLKQRLWEWWQVFAAVIIKVKSTDHRLGKGVRISRYVVALGTFDSQ